MGWAKLDDAFPTNPKVVGLSDRAFRAYVVGICYSAQHMTDGFLPGPWVVTITSAKVRAELHAAGLWDILSTGFAIHDYLIYNPTREDALRHRETQRAQRSAAGKARAASAQRAAGKFAQRSDQPRPVPSPPVPPVVGVDPEPDTPIAVGNRGEAASEESNGHKPFHLADVVNLSLIVSLKDRYRRRKPWDGVTEGLLTGLVLGGRHGPGFGARAVNAAIDDLYENAAGVSNPSGYLRERSEAHASSSTSSTAQGG